MCISGNSSSTPSPVTPQVDQLLQDAAEKTIGEKQYDIVHEPEKAIEVLRQDLVDQTTRAEELATDLEVCKRYRGLYFNTALRLFRSPEDSVMVERRNLIHQMNQLKFEVLERDSQIWSRDQLIDSLRSDVALYAKQGQRTFLGDSFHVLQAKYGQDTQRLEQKYQTLEQKYQRLGQEYEDLKNEHIVVSNRFKTLERGHIQLEVLYNQVKSERDLLEDDAKTSKQTSAEAAVRFWALEVERYHIIEQKVESENKARAREQRLMKLAVRMFKRTVFMAGILDDLDADPIDDEQMTLYELAYKYLGLDATEITDSFKKIRAIGVREVKEERDEISAPENYRGDFSSSMSAAEFNNHEQPVPIVVASGGSTTAATQGKDVPESRDTFNAKRQRRVAVAEEKVRGPMGLGFEAGSPMLKTKRIPERSRRSKILEFMGPFPTSTVTTSKTAPTGGNLLAAGAEDIDQFTPARTGSTCVIARDQWEIPGGDPQEFTQVFMCPRAQPTNIVSPGVGTKAAEDASRIREQNLSQDSEGGGFSSTNEDGLHGKRLVEELAVGPDLGNAEDDEAAEEEHCHDTAAVFDEFTIPGGHEGETRIYNHIATNPSTPAIGESSDIWKGTSFWTGKVHQRLSFTTSQKTSPSQPAPAI